MLKQVLKQGINIKTVCPNYLLKFVNTKSHLMLVYLGTLTTLFALSLLY